MSISSKLAVLLAAGVVGCHATPTASTTARAATPDAPAAAPPRCAPKGVTTTEGEPLGCLDATTIQRVVRGNFGKLRVCYEQGLARTPTLEGRIAVRFIIDRDGTVREARDGGSEFADSSVVGCVVDGFRPMRFPAPEGGIVIVVYPIVFRPGG